MYIGLATAVFFPFFTGATVSA